MASPRQFIAISAITVFIATFHPAWTQDITTGSGDGPIVDPIFIQQDTAIVTNPVSKAVDQHKSAYFRCSVNTAINLESQVIAWLIDDKPFSHDGQIDVGVLDDILGEGQEDRYRIVLGKKSVIMVDLNITSAQGVDNGREFHCAVCSRSPVEGERTCHRVQLESDIATLNVTYRPDTTKYPACTSILPDFPAMSIVENQTTVVVGHSVVLNCTSELANPAVTLKWLKNDDLIQGVGDEFGGFTNLQYTFDAALADNKTVFKCALRSDRFNLDAECELPPVKVVSYPKVSLQSPGALPAGKLQQFVCTSSSNTSDSKKFQYTWTYDSTFSRPEIITNTSGSVFQLNALSGDHGDLVRCFVKDTDGMTTQASATIKIESDLSVGAIAGIVSAIVLCVALLLLAIGIVVSQKKKSNRDEEPPPPSAVPMLPSSLKPEKLNEQQFI